MKKISFILLIVLLLNFAFSTSLVQAKNTEILINGDIVQFTNNSGYPFVDKNNRTLVPFRITLEKFGAKVDWDSTNNMAIAEKDNIIIKVPIGTNYIFRNDEKIIIDTVSVAKDGRTYLPIRPVIEAFNGSVGWDGVNNSVIIKSESLAQEIHYNAWKDVANKAMDQPQYKYGIYLARSMAVKHPEIYLQGDRLFYEKILSSEFGMKAFFENKTKNYQERVELSKNVRAGNVSLDPLLWTDIDIKEFTKMSYNEFYSGQPLLSYVDIRMFPLATALQPVDMKMVPLNMAEIMYFQERNLKKSNPYILMAENGNAYVWSDGKLLGCSGNEVHEITEKVVLIFNEDYVWYPLMDRDDTEKDTVLKDLAHTYTNADSSVPKLSNNEARLVEILKISTDIDDEIEELKIKYYTSKIYNGYLRSPLITDFNDREIFTVYDKEKNRMRELDTGFIYYIIAKNSNYLSPITAHYASITRELENQNLYNLTSTAINDFHNRTSTGHDEYSTISALSLWKGEYIYSNIDDTWLTKSSGCMDSASNAASIFDLANIKGLEIIAVSMGFTDYGGGHMNLAVYRGNEKRLIENFGSHGQNHNALINFGTSIFRGFIIDQYWVMFHDDYNPNNMITYTNKNKEWILSTLDHIKDRSDSKAIIVNTTDIKTGAIDGINIVDFINNFNPNSIVIYEY